MEDDVALKALLDTDSVEMAKDTGAFEEAVKIKQGVIDGEELGGVEENLGGVQEKLETTGDENVGSKRRSVQCRAEMCCLHQVGVRHWPYTWLMCNHAISLKPRQ